MLIIAVAIVGDHSACNTSYSKTACASKKHVPGGVVFLLLVLLLLGLVGIAVVLLSVLLVLIVALSGSSLLSATILILLATTHVPS